jgi:hypothetical protein
MKKISYVFIEKDTRVVNYEADALAKLAKELGESTKLEIHITIHNKRSLSLCQAKGSEIARSHVECACPHMQPLQSLATEQKPYPESR